MSATVKILYLAKLREDLGRNSESLELPDGVTTVDTLRVHLMQRGEIWQQILAEGNALSIAVNHDIARPETPVKPGDEIAFFPPVTGGLDNMPVRVQREDFDAGAEIARLRQGDAGVGAVACFIGVARDVNDGSSVSTMALEHYPGMTEKALEAIVDEAKGRWELIDALVIHRIGELKPTDQIVLVAVTSAHRGEAFAACEFIMDYLKTRAPFWKKEQTDQGTRWVEARVSDDVAAGRWK